MRARPRPWTGILFGVCISLTLWAIVIMACWRFAEWLQQ